MKKISLIIFMLCIPLVYSLYGGETWRYYFPKCDTLEINVYGTLPIDDGEYTILNDCNEIGENYWSCNCYNGYSIRVVFKENTINNFTFHFNYDYSIFIEEQEGRSSYSGGAFTIRFTDNQSRILMMTRNLISRFWINDVQHIIRLVWISNDSIILEITSKPMNITLYQNESKQIEIDNETLKMTLRDVRMNVAFVEFEKVIKKTEIKDIGGIIKKNITEPIISEVYNETINAEENITEEEIIIKEPSNLIGIMIVIFIVLTGIILYGIYWFRKEGR